MTTQDQLLLEAQAIAKGLSSVEPSERHLIAMSEEIKRLDLEIVRLNDKVGLLLRTIGMLDQLHPDVLQERLS
jgi:hypothetical protein